MNRTFTMQKRQRVAKFMLAAMACFTLASATAAYAADEETSAGSIDIQGGTDSSEQMTAVNSFGASVVGFLLNTVAKVIGVGIAVWGITDLVKREVMWGGVKLCLCGACFFLNKIIDSLSALGGGT